MKNLFKIDYNGDTICSDENYCSGDYSTSSIDISLINDNGTKVKDIATLHVGKKITLNIQGKKCEDYIGFKNPVRDGTFFIDSEGKYFISNLEASLISLFPEEPSEYTDLVGTYTASGTWTAPENGYFQIELYGASGNGGNYRSYAGGGGGGGGCCVISRVKLNQGDTIVYTLGAVGNNSQASITSTIENETYDTMIAYNATNGTNADSSDAGKGGEGGLAANGNYANHNGSDGSDGTQGNILSPGAGGAGGASGYDGGNNGGNGGTPSSFMGSATEPETGLPGFMKIYRGNTNI